jgi:hypothetical protein
MRINIYTEELIPSDFGQRACEIVTAEYVSSRTGRPMKNYGLRIYTKSHPDLHYIPGRDDDRSAVTFWCGPNMDAVKAFTDALNEFTHIYNVKWKQATEDRQNNAELELKENG